MRYTRFAFLSAAILLTSGCGSSGDTPDLGQVSGDY